MQRIQGMVKIYILLITEKVAHRAAHQSRAQRSESRLERRSMGAGECRLFCRRHNIPPGIAGGFRTTKRRRRKEDFLIPIWVFNNIDKVVQSFSKSARPHDNAVEESFFASMEREEIYRA